MPLSPRFRRVAALERRFVNRESALEAFADELSRVGDRPRVLNVTGVGGIGKSRLLRELRNRVTAAQACRTAVLDRLPFYLHLAIDTGVPSGRATTVVSSEEIVQRFLQHVSATEVRCLELLSIARIFDLGIFKELAGAFDLPSDRLTWESLTAYSFVYPAGDTEHRLHQLMAAALRERLSSPVVRETHVLLRELWDRRTVQDGAVADVRGFREAVYHGVRAATMPAEEVLSYADQAARYGGRQAADGIRTDLQEYLRNGAHPELARTVQCLAAESAILMGDADTAALVAASGSWPNLARPADARLAIAAAHARRISGDTSAAGRLFDAVWRHHGGPVRHTAGLWVAGQPHPDVTRAADAARARIESLDSIADLEQRAATLIAALLGGMTVEWQDVYHTAAEHLEAAAGYYNNNVRVHIPTGPVNVRIPIPDADVMDLRLWREEEILPALAGYVRKVPPLLHSSNEPRYQVHGFIDGVVLDTIAPRGVAVPPHVPADVVTLLTELTTIPRGRLPATPAGWPQDDDTITFAQRLSGLTRQVYATYRDDYFPQFQAFRFPAEPLAAVEAAWPALTRRPLVCVHSDIHRKNMIIKDGVSYFLDWELALWGDPVYDLAVHFHKMGYAPAERDHVLALWQAALRPEHTVGCEHDLDVYLAHEQIKSAIVDTVRYSQAFLDPSYAPEPGHALVGKLTGKLNNAYRRWGMPDRVDTTVVEATLLGWAESRRRRW